MKRTHLLSTAAVLASVLLAAAPASAQQTPQDRATAAADRMHKNNGTNGGPAELLRSAQAAMRRGQTAEANELLERAETRLLLRDAAGNGRAAAGEPAHHVSEARRALVNRDRAEAMRHPNLAIAAAGGGDTGTGGGGLFRGVEGGGAGGRSVGALDSGMGGPVAGRAIVRDAGTGGTSVSRAEGVLLAQSGTGAGTAAPPPTAPRTGRGVPPAATLPPGDTLPGWSGPGTGGTGAQGSQTGRLPTQDFMPDSFSRGGANSLNFSSPLGGPDSSGITGGAPAPSSSSMTGGEAARLGGAPPSDTSRAPGSSGISGAGVGNSAVGGPIR